jgi:flavin reductase (DIM6/NTAB) family NADH-FMN oxidoreductase RutF
MGGQEADPTVFGQPSAVPGERTGALILDSVGWLECTLRDHLDVGGHTVVIGEVLATGTRDRRSPLVFLRGRFYGAAPTPAKSPLARSHDLPGSIHARAAHGR